jgi:hypothetical protein
LCYYFFFVYLFNIVVIIIPVLLLILNPIHKTMALSPSFELQEIINQNHHWVQTYGNSDAHLETNYTDILAVDYISNGKNLNATFWLASTTINVIANVLLSLGVLIGGRALASIIILRVGQ